MGVVFSLYYGWDASLVDKMNITLSVVAVKGRGFNFPIDLSSRHHPRTSKARFAWNGYFNTSSVFSHFGTNKSAYS
jgi:hypothetical protein